MRKEKNPRDAQECFITRTESNAGGVWGVPSRARADVAFAMGGESRCEVKMHLLHLSAEFQDIGTVSAKRNSTLGAPKLSKGGIWRTALKVLSEWRRRGEMRGDGEWDGTRSYRIKAKSENQSYVGGRNRNSLDKKHKDTHEENFSRTGGWKWGGEVKIR